MGKQQQLEEEEEIQPQEQHKQSKSLRSRAAHFVSDLTTVLLNPISDKPSIPSSKPSFHDDLNKSEHSQPGTEEGSGDSVDGPDTSSFTAFLYSLLANSEPRINSFSEEKIDSHEDDITPSPEPVMRENGKKKSLYSRGKQSIGRAFTQVVRIGGFRNQFSKGTSDMVVGDKTDSVESAHEGIDMKTLNESVPSEDIPETSEPSLLLSEKTRSVLYAALPLIVKGRKWVLLYSTWRHGVSLSTLYRRSMIWPGLSLLVIGDHNGAVFGGLVDAPLRPTNKRRYQGTNKSFVFTTISGHPLIYCPTARVNRYFTLCSMEYLALGGGGHFALYLDGDLLSGTSSSSETYGNPCLSGSEDFEVKEIELWGFVYATKYEEMIASLRTEAPGICHW